MIFFEDWSLRTDGQVIAQQFDNLTRTLVVQGEVPDDWEWTMLVQVGEAMDILPLTFMKEGLGIVLTAGQLSGSGYYKMQLRATRGELVRHTNTINVYIPASLSGDRQWPNVPSEFTDLERRAAEAVYKAEKAAGEAENSVKQVGAAEKNVDEARIAAQNAASAAGQSEVNASVSERAAAEYRSGAEQAALRAEGHTSHPPIVGENGNWWGWDGTQYIDSGKPSQGELTVRQGSNLYTNALKGTASGAAVRVDDAGPLEHTVPVKVSSKNLLNCSYQFETNTVNGVTATINGDEIILNGTATANGVFHIGHCSGGGEVGESYTLSLKCVSGHLSGTGYAQLYLLERCETESEGTSWIQATINSASYENASATRVLNRGHFSLLRFWFAAGVAFDNYTFKAQLEKGTTATAYTPYVPDLTAVTVYRHGKNLCHKASITTEEDWRGRIFLRKNNYPWVMTRGIKYTLSADVTVYSDDTAAIRFFDLEVRYTDGSTTLGRVTIHDASTIQDGVTRHYCASVQVAPDKEVSDIVLATLANDGSSSQFLHGKAENIQFEIGGTETAYEPYIAPVTYTVAEDGTCEVTSLAPTMTLTTDNPNVVMECEYNRDINKAYDRMVQAIISMGGNI